MPLTEFKEEKKTLFNFEVSLLCFFIGLINSVKWYEQVTTEDGKAGLSQFDHVNWQYQCLGQSYVEIRIVSLYLFSLLRIWLTKKFNKKNDRRTDGRTDGHRQCIVKCSR